MKEEEEENKNCIIKEMKNDDDFEIIGETNDDNIKNSEEKKEEMKQIKVILLGEAGVGKTCIICRYVNGEYHEDTLSTVSVSFEEKTVKLKDENETEIKMEIWDTYGQEKYRNIVNIFYKKAKAVLLVYDLTSAESFEKMKEFWYYDAKEKADKDIGKF